jgi:hypothetical protein
MPTKAAGWPGSLVICERQEIEVDGEVKLVASRLAL